MTKARAAARAAKRIRTATGLPMAVCHILAKLGYRHSPAGIGGLALLSEERLSSLQKMLRKASGGIEFRLEPCCSDPSHGENFHVEKIFGPQGEFYVG